MPQVDLANSILKHLLLFFLGPEICWCLAFPHCLFGILCSSLTQQGKGSCELLLSRSLAASDGCHRLSPLLMPCSSASAIQTFIVNAFLGWNPHVLHLKVSMLQHQHAQSA